MCKPVPTNWNLLEATSFLRAAWVSSNVRACDGAGKSATNVPFKRPSPEASDCVNQKFNSTFRQRTVEDRSHLVLLRHGIPGIASRRHIRLLHEVRRLVPPQDALRDRGVVNIAVALRLVGTKHFSLAERLGGLLQVSADALGERSHPQVIRSPPRMKTSCAGKSTPLFTKSVALGCDTMCKGCPCSYRASKSSLCFLRATTVSHSMRTSRRARSR